MVSSQSYHGNPQPHHRLPRGATDGSHLGRLRGLWGARPASAVLWALWPCPAAARCHPEAQDAGSRGPCPLRAPRWPEGNGRGPWPEQVHGRPLTARPTPARGQGRASEPRPALPNQTWSSGRSGLRNGNPGLVGGRRVLRGSCGREPRQPYCPLSPVWRALGSCWGFPWGSPWGWGLESHTRCRPPRRGSAPWPGLGAGAYLAG